MPVDATLAAVHLRIEAAGQSLEQAVSLLRIRRVFYGRAAVQQAVSDLQQAAAYLKTSGQYPALLAYMQTLVTFYQGEVGKVMRPANAPAVGDTLAGNQGLLLSADPLLFPSVAH